MGNLRGENFLVQALDERIRAIVEEVLSTVLTRQTQGGRGAVVVRSGRTVTNHQPVVRNGRRGRPRKDQAEIEGKIVKTTSTPQGTVIYTDNEKYLRRRDGSVIRVSHVKGSLEPVRAMGYSSAQYQLARRHNWPMPCPMDFEPPARGRRGRRAKAAKQ
jgi:hypothetical protein